MWEFDAKDLAARPGTPLITRGRGGWKSFTGTEEPIIRQDGNWIYLVDWKNSASGARPYLDRYDIKSGRRERLFQSTGESYEEVLAVLDPDAHRILTRHESLTEPPNYYTRDLRTGTRQPVVQFSQHSDSPLAGVQVQLIHYVRADGVPLTGQLYLPRDYKSGQPLPTVIWAYPQEYSDKATASQMMDSPYRFPLTGRGLGKLPVALAMSGYAVLWNASVPILGGENANDTALPQFISSAEAAVEKLTQMGIARRGHVGIAGHSYGALMVATLLAHSDLFAAGVAIDGVYNLTAVPAGFQRERRTLWQAPDTYMNLSALMHADRIQAPLLLIHGAADTNYMTKPAQAEQMYQALRTLGKKARLVLLPHEKHQPIARESVLHCAWELQNWFDRYLRLSAP